MPVNPTGEMDFLGKCGQCRKWTYRTRKLARQAMKKAHPGAHLNAYFCPHAKDGGREGWHYGHLRVSQIAEGIVPQRTPRD